MPSTPQLSDVGLPDVAVVIQAEREDETQPLSPFKEMRDQVKGDEQKKSSKSVRRGPVVVKSVWR
jgi:hypothetical protein